jgi:hypothetical protein
MRLFKLVLLLCCISAVMFAGPIGTCTANLLSNYVSNQTSCQLGELIFSDFEYGPNHFPGNPGPAANTITISPITDPGDPGFLFSTADWMAAGAGNFGDSTISYLISSATGAPIIGAVDLGVTETIASEPVTLIVNETVCVGVSTPAGQCPEANTVTLDNSNTPGSVTAIPYATFAPVSEVTVLKDIYFASDGSTGNGQILSVSNTYPTPEPAAAVLSLGGLAAIWLAKRRVMGVRKL